MNDTASRHDAFAHTAVYYDGVADLVGRVVPMIEGAVGDGDAVLVSIDDVKWAHLARALGPIAESVTHLSDAQRYARPVVAMQVLDRFMGAALAGGSARVWSIGELAFGGLVPDDEWFRYEGAANEAFGHLPAQLVCLFDLGALPASIVAGARSVHDTGHDPVDLRLVGDDRRGGRGPRWAAPLGLIEASPIASVEPVPTVAAARRTIRAAVQDLVDDEMLGDLELVASELASNALRYGVPPVDMHVWVRAGQIDLEMCDRGVGPDDRFAGLRLPTAEPGGLGLWICGRVADRLLCGPTPDGWTARATFLRA